MLQTGKIRQFLEKNNHIKYESSGNRNKNLSVNEYLNEIKTYLRDIMIIAQIPDMQKIPLTIPINLIYSKEVYEDRVMHPKSSNIEYMTYDNANEIVDILFSTCF